MYAKQFNDNTLRIYEDDLIISFNEEFSSNHNFEIRNYKNKIKDKNIKDHKYIEFDDYIILYSVNKIDTKHIALLKKINMTSIYMSFQKEQNEKWKYTSYRSNSGSVLFSLVPFGNNSNMKRASFL